MPASHTPSRWLRRGLAVCLSIAAIGPSSMALAQSPDSAAAKTYTIAMVLPRDNQNIEAGFTNYLQRQGLSVRYVPIRYSGDAQDIPTLREQVRAAKPDLIYSWGTPTTLALAGHHDSKDGIRDTTIVFTEVTDPVGAGLITSLAKPGRNVTGVSHVAPLTVQLNAIRAYRPFKKLGYVHNPSEPNSQLILSQLMALAREQQFDVVTATLPQLANGDPDAAGIQPAIAKVAEQAADFLYIGPITYLAYAHRDEVTQAALAHKLPTFCATESIVRQSGCMFGLFANGNNIGAFAGSMAKRVLVDKQSPSAIPASSLQRFSLLINMRTASALTLYPPMLLLNVAEVINAPNLAASQGTINK